MKLTQDILDLAVANKCKTLEEVKALPMGNGTVPVSYTHLDAYKRQLIRLSGLVCRFTHRIIRWIIWKEEDPRNTLIRWLLVRTAGLVAELLYVPV